MLGVGESLCGVLVGQEDGHHGYGTVCTSRIALVRSNIEILVKGNQASLLQSTNREADELASSWRSGAKCLKHN